MVSTRKRKPIFKFPELILQKISQSPVFIYPSLLPSIPFKRQNRDADKKRMPNYTASEDELIAIGLEQFYQELQNDEKYRQKWSVPRIPDLAYFIAKYMIPIADQRKICGRIRQLKEKRAIENPVKYFFQNKEAPRTVHYVENISKLGMLPPFMRPPFLLSGQWKSFIYPDQFECVRQGKKVHKPPAFNKGLPTKKRRLIIPKSPSNSKAPIFLITHDNNFAINEINNSSNVINNKRSKKKSKPKCLSFDNNSKDSDPIFEEFFYENIELIPESNVNKSSTDITKNIQLDNNKTDQNPCSVIKEDYNSDRENNSSSLTNEFLLFHDVKKQSKDVDLDLDVENLIPENIISKSKCSQVFINTLDKTLKVSSNSIKISPKLLKYKFNSSLFSKYKIKNMLPSMPFLLTPQKEIIQNDLELSGQSSNDKSPTIEISLNEKSCISEKSSINEKSYISEKTSINEHKEVPSNETSQKLPIIQLTNDEIAEIIDNENELKKDDEDELNALMVASTTLQQKNRRIQTTLTKRAKQMKQYNATLAMLCPEDTKHIEEKAKNYAQAYYDKVQERLECASPVEYQRFMEALSEHDDTNSTVSDLYEKVSSVLSPKHSDLCEEFLTFLTAEQAQQIGKLVPHFMLSNMSLFLRKLEIYYSNQPAQLRRIYNCLTELAEMKDVTMDKIRSTILPLLKGNTLLINWFLQLFPKETPPESSMTDWEEINCDDGEETDDNERLYETLTLPEVEDPYGGPNCICKCHKIDDEMYRSRNRHCIPCGTKFLQGRVYIQTGKGLRLANVTFNNTSSDHSKRLNIKPFIRQKRKSETSQNKGILSPLKDDEPRHSNESEDDINADSITSRKLKSFRANSPSKSRKNTTNKSTPKIRKDHIKIKIKTDIPICRKSKSKIKSNEDNSNEPQEKLFSCSPVKEDTTKHEAIESETEVCDWDVKASPGPSIESVDTCEESSQDTLPAHGSESDDSIEVESVISENSDDSNDDTQIENENTHSWTRDEDKVILETFQQSGEEQKAFKEIQQRLPDRTIAEIKQRFHILMSLLQEMASK